VYYRFWTRAEQVLAWKRVQLEEWPQGSRDSHAATRLRCHSRAPPAARCLKEGWSTRIISCIPICAVQLQGALLQRTKFVTMAFNARPRTVLPSRQQVVVHAAKFRPQSRIGKKLVPVPKDVTLSLENNFLKVKVWHPGQSQ
jgi:hypothetical protein